MANLKISELTTYTGDLKDLRWFVMNDSSESTTYKFSGYTSPLKFATSEGSVVSYNYGQGDTNSPYSLLIGGSGNTISSTANYQAIISGFNNQITSTNKSNGIFASESSYISSNSFTSAIVASESSYITEGE
jgi:hypothetical protein